MVITSIRIRARYDGTVGPRCQDRRMTDTSVHDAADLILLEFLDAQRAAALAVVDGLDEAGLRTAVVPSGWTPLG
jgi:hypothetical protein